MQHRRGFTILELMIVVLIIGALMAVVFVAGRKVLSGGKASQTASVLQTLDTALNNAISIQGKIPAATVLVGSTRYPVSDVVLVGADDRVVDSVDWLLYQLESEGQDAAALVRGLDGKFQNIRTQSLPPRQPGEAAPPVSVFEITNKVSRQILDAWGRPVRYVHPQLDGSFQATSLRELLSSTDNAVPTTQYKRDRADKTTDGGSCVNNRPYFYSAGEDGDYSTVDDNVYTSKPTFANAP